MHRRALLFIFVVGGWIVAAACGSPTTFGERSKDASAPGQDATSEAQQDTGFGGTSDSPGCVNLECRQVNCGAGAETSISGVVLDPAGLHPLYNVYVYVPNAPTSPIEPGNVECKQCQAPASGSPLVSASTDHLGSFVLHNAPTGENIPLVMQVGKWRRQIVIPVIEKCTENVLVDPELMRLPKNQSEGDMPQIAFTSGCDPAECFLRNVGIDDAEFTAPTGTGRVHYYKGQYPSANVPSGNTWQDTYTWWSDVENLKKYDIVFNACECTENERNNGSGDAYQAMHDYLASGGRVFTTHYYYNWFSPPKGAPEFQTAIQWMPEQSFFPDPVPFHVDMSFPKGESFANWLLANGTSAALGDLVLTDLRYNMRSTTEQSTRWIYATPPGGVEYPLYASFNVPVEETPENQCGRAVFSDVHLSGSSSETNFPNECAGQGAAYKINETALEFLFFDLASCVQDDTKPPPPPPPN